MTQPNILKLAKQGNVEAIASLMNRHLHPKGITAKVAFQDACLEVILESAQVLNQPILLAFIRKGLTALGAVSVQKVKVYGQQTGKEFPAWSKEFDLRIAEIEAVDNEQSSSNPQTLTLSINLSGDTARGLTNKDFEFIANQISTDILSSCTNVFIQKVSISNGSSVITKER
ncbi:hypothetical protein CDG76_19750 [Nostoc sp. 'Peltigera membranacea cyanobiont' 210A]|uniref:hypothetical protein n=1 Tax=Nostoc sp. 'Peltigera membranacea cyanobiont' 210A TaxID=2014529 RepID=UPI000B959F8D|nr:hypothetical protein [Nostoc sp. 'Peltigera membranacea cyanobiont' 210A]OYD92943.1 hypothetical protein CDG76_19750 [Nostoc sp. 'Peltigera membranacea cyanobiont' 210A]